MNPSDDDHAPLSEHALNRLRWRSRRGLLENDLLLSRFFAAHGASLTVGQARALTALLELPDNALLDLLLGRMPLPADLAAHPGVVRVLHQLRQPNPALPTRQPAKEAP